MHGVVSFTMDMGAGSEVINKAIATRKAGELDAVIRGAEVDRLMAQVRLGVLALACIRHFQIPSKARCADMMQLPKKRIERATALAARLIDEKGNIDQAKLDAIRNDDGSMPCVHTAEKRLGMHVDHKPRSGTPNKVRQACRTFDRDTRDSGLPAGSASVNTPTPWRHDGDAHTEHRGGTHNPPAERVSLSPPPASGSAGGWRGAGPGASPSGDGHGPEPLAGGGRASTRAHRPAGAGRWGSGFSSPEDPAGGAKAGRPEPHRQAGAGVPAGVPAGAVQMTMDAMYAGALDGAERLIAELAELVEKDGLDAAMVMAAGEMFREGLDYLRKAARNGTARSGTRTPHGVLSRTTGA